jgi:cation transport ATPase
MGSCCFTPTKRDFLWWYWLLLVSIVGIPMFLAVLYVARWGNHGEEAEKTRVVRTAATIFWVGSTVIGVGLVFVVAALIAARESSNSVPRFMPPNYAGGYFCLMAQFLVGFVAANSTNDLVRKRRWYVRVPWFVASIAAYLIVLAALFLLFRRPAINVMQFAACMLPTHCWGRFKDDPTRANAWTTLAACVAGATLFFVASYHGEDFAQWICRLCPFLVWPSIR